MRAVSSLIGIWLVLAFAAGAADINATPTEDARLSQVGLQKLEQHFNAYVDEGKLAGYSALVARGGKVALLNTYGMQDIAAGKALRKDSIFRIYSMTKPVTSVAMMMLWEEGKFQLDDPVSKYIPSFKNQRVFSGLDEEGNVMTVPAKREVTILDLMRHTAGLTYGIFSDTPVDKMYRNTGLMNGLFNYDTEAATLRGEEINLQNFAKSVGALPLLYQPGEAWVYSVSVDVQGALVERLSGMPFEAFVAKRIFEPLGMTSTDFYVRPEWKDRFVEVYALDKDQSLTPYRGDSYSDFSSAPRVPSGGGGLVSTIEDYWYFAQMVANGGALNGVRLLKTETVDLMRRDHLPAELDGIAGGKSGLGFGLNFAVVKDVSKLGSDGRVGEYFWGGMANTLFWIDPTEEIVAIFMTNILPSGIHPLRADMRNLVYGAVK